MTELTKAVRRTAVTPWRDLVVTLLPGVEPMIEVREKRERGGYVIGLSSLYVILAERAASPKRRAK